MTRDKTSTRWGDGRRADTDFARQQILDAALRCFQDNTIEKTRMEHIAREAKVSRTTIYRHFKNRDEVCLGVVSRELNDLIGVMHEQISSGTSFAEFIVDTVAFADEKIQDSPVFELIVRETAVLMNRMQEYSAALIWMVSAYFRDRFDAAKAAGELREGIDCEGLADWITHVGASFIMMATARRDSIEFRQKLWRYLIPAIVHAEAIPADKRG